jgi:hypothetical protein
MISLIPPLNSLPTTAMWLGENEILGNFAQWTGRAYILALKDEVLRALLINQEESSDCIYLIYRITYMR